MHDAARDLLALEIARSRTARASFSFRERTRDNDAVAVINNKSHGLSSKHAFRSIATSSCSSQAVSAQIRRSIDTTVHVCIRALTMLEIVVYTLVRTCTCRL